MLEKTNEWAEVKDIDMGINFITQPPVLIPISRRAKAFMDLPAGCDGAIIAESAEKVLAALPDDWTFGNVTDELGPTIVAFGKVEEIGLH